MQKEKASLRRNRNTTSSVILETVAAFKTLFGKKTWTWPEARLDPGRKPVKKAKRFA